jgi:hypothetical protein
MRFRRIMSLVPNTGSVTVTYGDSMMHCYPLIRSSSSVDTLEVRIELPERYQSKHGPLQHAL